MRRRILAILVVAAALLGVVLASPGEGATSTFNSSVSATGTQWRTHAFQVTAVGPITATLNWTTTTANLNLFLLNPSGTTVASATSNTARPERITFNATTTGQWLVRVRGVQGSSSYTATVQHSVSSSTTTTASTTTTTSATTTTTRPPGEQRPNVVLVLTDDQRWDTVTPQAMPVVTRELAGRGVTFTNSFTVNPLCCPSRAATLRGAYPHTTGVYQNGNQPNGPFTAFNDSSTVATWMRGGGYRTAFVGKYFNGYDQSRVSYVPPGWDRWAAFATNDVGGGAFYNYTLSVDGSPVSYGGGTNDYSTDVLAGHATSFIRSVPADQPLFLTFAPYAPHQPNTPAPRHTNAFAGIAPYRPPNYNEADVSDKPAHIRSVPLITSTSVLDRQRQRQLESLLAVDEAVEDILTALNETGRLRDTLIVFTSDNGFSWGEHRWGQTGAQNKQVPYDESSRVPLVVRYDALTQQARTEGQLALNIDLAPTFAALAGVGTPGAEGRSLLPLLEQTATSWRTDFLIENARTAIPSYCAVRTATHLYVQYDTLEEELYDVVADPYQLTNRAADAAMASTRNAMRTRVRQLCNPIPPSFRFIATG
jgi:arylsulfatase A-like enzyme